MDSRIVGRRDNPFVVEVPVGDVKNLDSRFVFSIRVGRATVPIDIGQFKASGFVHYTKHRFLHRVVSFCCPFESAEIPLFSEPMPVQIMFWPTFGVVGLVNFNYCITNVLVGNRYLSEQRH